MRRVDGPRNLAVVLSLLPSAVFGDACSEPKYFSGVQNVSLEVGNLTRVFQLSSPWEGGECSTGWCTGPVSTPKPLVMNWHGCSPHVPVLDYAEEISRVVG
jgi:hypothetical protein